MQLLIYVIHAFRHVLPLISGTMARLSHAGAYQTKDLWLAMEEAANIKAMILEQWNTLELDVVIAPGFPFEAPPLDFPTKLSSAAPCTGAYNVINLPVGSLPVIRKSKEDQVHCLKLL